MYAALQHIAVSRETL